MSSSNNTAHNDIYEMRNTQLPQTWYTLYTTD